MNRLLPMLIVLSCARFTGAAVSIGDTPDFRLQTTNGRTVTPQTMAGKMVVIEFWATWCGPCIAQVPHLKKLHEKYRRRGVVLLGISRDDNMDVVQRFTQRKGMNWPQVLDKDQRPQLASLFGVGGIPHAFIISPEGKVLWRGHPAKIDRPLEDALEKHPPDTKNFRISHGPESSKDPPEKGSSPRQVRNAAKSNTMPNPTRRGELERRATNLLRIADRRRKDGKHADAYIAYLKIRDRYHDTETATTAAAQCNTYESDDRFIAEYRKTIAERKAKATMRLAEAYKKQGKNDLARLHYQEVLERYPGTEIARAAAKKIK